MTGEDFKAIRASYGETQYAFGLRLGYVGKMESVTRKVKRYERGETPISGPLQELLALLKKRKK